jgi:cytoskeletal protein CcmA (bactofilin family)
MFKKHNQKSRDMNTEAMNSNNIIGKGTTFTGNIQTHGNIRIEGRVVGDLTSKAKVVIGPSAYVEGKVLAQVVEIEGEIKGSIEVTDLLILKTNCKIYGDIITDKLIVESGAKFEGQSKMNHSVKNKIELTEMDTDNMNTSEKLKKVV